MVVHHQRRRLRVRATARVRAERGGLGLDGHDDAVARLRPAAADGLGLELEVGRQLDAVEAAHGHRQADGRALLQLRRLEHGEDLGGPCPGARPSASGMMLAVLR